MYEINGDCQQIRFHVFFNALLKQYSEPFSKKLK